MASIPELLHGDVDDIIAAIDAATETGSELALIADMFDECITSKNDEGYQKIIEVCLTYENSVASNNPIVRFLIAQDNLSHYLRLDWLEDPQIFSITNLLYETGPPHVINTMLDNHMYLTKYDEADSIEKRTVETMLFKYLQNPNFVGQVVQRIAHLKFM